MWYHLRHDVNLYYKLIEKGHNVYTLHDEMIVELPSLASIKSLGKPVVLEKRKTSLNNALNRMIYRQTHGKTDPYVVRGFHNLMYCWFGKGL